MNYLVIHPSFRQHASKRVKSAASTGCTWNPPNNQPEPWHPIMNTHITNTILRVLIRTELHGTADAPLATGGREAAVPQRQTGLIPPIRSRITAGAAVILAACLIGCASMPPPPPPPLEARSPSADGSLAAGDEIRITFQGAPELNNQQRIRPNGRISLPSLGEITAAGMSIGSLESRLRAAYQPRLQDPAVSISLVSSASGVYVSGAVQRPGKIMLYRPMTAMEAVMEAGGFTPMANPKQVTVIRTRNGASKNFLIDLDQVLKGTSSTPFYVKSYDVIHVGERVW